MMHLLAAILVSAAASVGVATECTEEIPLFNGKDLSGWKVVSSKPWITRPCVWTVHKGILCCRTGLPMGYLRTERRYANYRLRFEWRWTDWPGNSGVLIHVREPDKVWPRGYEVQLQRENAGDLYAMDGEDFSERVRAGQSPVPKREPSNERSVGFWNRGEIVCVGDSLRVYVNGVLQNEATGMTAQEGYIALQSEKAPIEFRRITLQPETVEQPDR